MLFRSVSQSRYTAFHLCDKPLLNITEGGTSYLVSPPCTYHGNYITTRATKRYDEYVKTRLVNKIMLAVAKLRELDKFDSATFRKLANDNNLYEHLENIAGEECSVQKTFLRLDCYASHCIDPVNGPNTVSKETTAYHCLYDNLRRGLPLIPDTKN